MADDITLTLERLTKEVGRIADMMSGIQKISDSLDVIANSPMYRAPKPDIYEIGLLKTKEYHDFSARVPHYGAAWWLDAGERNPMDAPLVTRDGRVDNMNVGVNWAMLRPALYIANGSEFAFKQCVKVGKYYFTYIGSNCMICNVCVGAMSYKEIMAMKHWQWTNIVFGYWDWEREMERKPMQLDIPQKSRITLLSSEEFEKLKENIPVLEKKWWLRDIEKNMVSAVSEGDRVTTETCDDRIRYELRPAVVIPNKRLKLEPKTSIMIGKRSFTYIGDNYLLCDDSIGTYSFRAKPASWEASELCATLSDIFFKALG